MSVTSQLKSKKSPVNTFFQENCKKNGLIKIHKSLRDNRQFNPGFSYLRPVSSSVPMMFGLICDYLIKQQIGGRLFTFEDVIGHFPIKNLIPFNSSQPLRRLDHYGWHGISIESEKKLFEKLLKISSDVREIKRKLTPDNLISLLGCSILDAYFRSGHFPQKFVDRYIDWEYFETKFAGKIKPTTEAKVSELLRFYGASLDKSFRFDYLLHEVDTVFSELKDERRKGGNLYKVKCNCISPVFLNAAAIGGGDGDIIITKNRKKCLIDIKTKIKNIESFEIKQLIVYWLLHSPETDDFTFSDVGIYYARTGNLKIIEEDRILREYFKGKPTKEEIRSKFLDWISQS